jgi:hypothetical protein
LLIEQAVNRTIRTVKFGRLIKVKVILSTLSCKSSMQSFQYVIQCLRSIICFVQHKFILLVEQFEQLCSHLVAIEYLHILVLALKLSGLLVEIP